MPPNIYHRESNTSLLVAMKMSQSFSQTVCRKTSLGKEKKIQINSSPPTLFKGLAQEFSNMYKFCYNNSIANLDKIVNCIIIRKRCKVHI